MRYREFLRSRLNKVLPKSAVLPSGFHVVGHVALVHLNSELMKYASLLGQATLDFDHRLKSVAVQVGPTTGVERRPSYKVVAGSEDTTTIHIENNIRFKFDPIRMTFSGGNKGERINLSRQIRPGECVVDMFSCVGQFALHIAKNNDVKVIAIEINPDAYLFLKENIEINGLQQRVIPILGDCRVVHPVHVANRIVMGYLHNTQEFLPYALDTLIEEGGLIHMHKAVKDGLVNDSITCITNICKNRGIVAEVKSRVIKNYAPGVHHIVFDISAGKL